MNIASDSFNYIAEASKCEFQQTISSLLEFHLYLSNKIEKASANRKTVVFSSIEESKTLCNFLLKSVGDLSAHYTILDRCLRQLNNQQRLAEALLLSNTPQLLATLLNKQNTTTL